MKTQPNVIIIYADDLGYGDLSCYGAEDIHTPNIDRLAEEGIRFQNAYSTSAVCTPARYSLMTGQYPFRNPDTFILPGNAKCIIDPDTMTLPRVFRQAGYRTGVVGKWHLGLGDGNIDWNGEISRTPNDVGFDESFIFPGTADRVPCVYVRNRRVEGLDEADPIEVSYEAECPFDDIDTYEKNPEKLRMLSSNGHNMSVINGVGRIGYMRGGKAALWRDEDLAEDFLKESQRFIDSSEDTPFFLLYTVHQPHVPRVPNERFAGATGLGPRGDVIAELDWCVGELVSHLEKKGILEDTLILFSSDNGPVLDDGYKDFAVRDNATHSPAGPFRAGKYSILEGGSRIPFIVKWPGVVKPGVTSKALFNQMDLAASLEQLLEPGKANSFRDSENVIPALLGKSAKGRDYHVINSTGKALAIRHGKWKFIPAGVAIRDGINGLGAKMTKSPEGGSLFDLEKDPKELNNVAAQHPDICEQMKAKLQEIRQRPETKADRADLLPLDD